MKKVVRNIEKANEEAKKEEEKIEAIIVKNVKATNTKQPKVKTLVSKFKQANVDVPQSESKGTKAPAQGAVTPSRRAAMRARRVTAHVKNGELMSEEEEGPKRSVSQMKNIFEKSYVSVVVEPISATKNKKKTEEPVKSPSKKATPASPKKVETPKSPKKTTEGTPKKQRAVAVVESATKSSARKARAVADVASPRRSVRRTAVSETPVVAAEKSVSPKKKSQPKTPLPAAPVLGKRARGSPAEETPAPTKKQVSFAEESTEKKSKRRRVVPEKSTPYPMRVSDEEVEAAIAKEEDANGAPRGFLTSVFYQIAKTLGLKH